MKAENALIIYGSPKGMKGSAANLADYFGSKLQEKGLQVEKVAANRSLTDAEEKERLLGGFDKADVVMICFPLYVDTLPAGLLQALHMIVENGARMSQKERVLAAECHCGFPEGSQTATALANCKHFADRMGMKYAGGIGLGQGPMFIEGKVNEMKYAKNHLPLFGQAIDSIVKGEEIPKSVLDGMKRQFVPTFMYLFFVNRGWNSSAKKNGVRSRIKEMPYLKP
jgi:multimeric flavodoxin WrbA